MSNLVKHGTDVADGYTMSRDVLMNTPLRERLHEQGRAMTKIVRGYGKPFLIRRSLDDIALEEYGHIGKRVLVLMDESDEALQMSLWCYSRKALPLVCEKHILKTAAIFARQYDIDTLITDSTLLFQFLQEFKAEVHHSIVIGKHFPDTSLYGTLEKLPTLILSLPETGILGKACVSMLKEKKLLFHPDVHTLLECIDDRIIATRKLSLPTPIVRYDTGLFGREIPTACFCDKTSFVLT